MKKALRLPRTASHALLNTKLFNTSPLLCIALLFPALLHAQTAHYSGALVSVASGLSNPQGVAVDVHGNIFFAEQTTGSVKEVLATSGYLTVDTLASSFSNPRGIALDASGNVFVADSGNHAVSEILVVGGYSTVNTLSTAFTNPKAVAVDSSGNVFVADAGDGAVKEILASGGYTTINTLSSGFSQPSAIAVDSSGNIFLADPGTHQVYEIIAYGGYMTVTSVSTSFTTPTGIATDPAGHLFVSDSGNAFVTELIGAGYATSINLGAGLSSPAALALDASGNIFVSDAGNNTVKRIFTGGLDAGSAAVGTVGTPVVSLSFTFDTGGTILAPAVLTQGAPALDFTDLTTGTCTSNGTSYSYAIGETCSVDVAFTPHFPGSRYGAVVLADSSSNTLARAYVYGTGRGPQALFLKASPTRIDPAITTATGVAVDGAGSLYISDPTNNVIVKEQSGSPSPIPTSSTAIGSAVAVDGAGNIYIADATSSRVLKEAPSAASYIESVITSSAIAASSIAVDGSGNVFITDAGQSLVFKETLNAGVYAESTFLTTSPVNAPTGIAVDTAGNVYIADTGNNRVLAETLTSGSYVESTIGTGLSAPAAIAVGSGGNLYIADAGNSRILLEAPSSGSYTQSTLIDSVSALSGLGVSDSGNVYYAVGKIYSLPFADAQTFAFASTALGSSSSPYGMTLANIGNATLTFPTPGTGFNPSIASNFTLDSSGGTACPLLSTMSGPATLAPGATCTLSIAFAPTVSGSITGSLVLTDDSLNTPVNTQTVALSGTGTRVDPGLALSIADHSYGDAPFTVSATSSSTGAVTYAVVSGPASISANTLTITGAGAIVVSASQAADGNYASGSQNASFNVAKQTPTITFAVADQVYGVSPFTVSASSASSGAVTYSVVSGPATISASTVTITGVGGVVLAASQPADANYAAANQNVTFNVSGQAATITFTIAGHTYGDAAITLAATSTSAGAFTYAVVSGPASISANTLTITGAGAIVVSASEAADGNYASGSQNASFNVGMATPTLTFAVANHVLGDAPFSVSASSASTGPISYTLVSGAATVSTSGTVTLTGVGAIVITATQAADANFVSSTQNVTFSVMERTVWVASTTSTLSAFDISGLPLSGSGFTGGGLSNIASPLGMAFDHSNSVWVANMSGGVSKFASDGTPVGSGFSGGGIDTPHSVAVDGDGQLWIANGNGSVSALTNTGTALTPGTGFTGAGLATPGAIAVDLSGNVWVTNTSDDSVTEIIGVAAPVAPLSTSVTAATAGARP